MTELIVSLISLIALEVVLGIDNIIFISILADKLPAEKRNKLRLWGIGLALVMRLALLGLINWIMKFDETLFEFSDIKFTGKGLILLGGGLFLIYKSIKEIVHKIKKSTENQDTTTKTGSFGRLLMEVILLDLVFSIDSIITAVGMVDELWVMYTAVIITVVLMLIASKPISDFIVKYPSFKILALCFLLMIGISLVLEGLTIEFSKAIIYVSMLFSTVVSFLQLKTTNIK